MSLLHPEHVRGRREARSLLIQALVFGLFAAGMVVTLMFSPER